MGKRGSSRLCSVSLDATASCATKRPKSEGRPSCRLLSPYGRPAHHAQGRMPARGTSNMVRCADSDLTCQCGVTMVSPTGSEKEPQRGRQLPPRPLRLIRHLTPRQEVQGTPGTTMQPTPIRCVTPGTPCGVQVSHEVVPAGLAA